jgi:hypothetical protein
MHKQAGLIWICIEEVLKLTLNKNIRLKNMKNVKGVIAVLFAAALLSFGNSSSSDQMNRSESAQAPSGSDGDASFSCILDGKEFSGKGTDQNINAAFHLTGNNKGQIFFRLSDMNNIGDKLMFQVPSKEGSTTIKVSPTYSYGGYITSDFATYIDDPVMVTINSISSSRVSGTFSGKYTLQKGSGNSNLKQTIEITNGKFNIPFSTSAHWKQLYHAE